MISSTEIIAFTIIAIIFIRFFIYILKKTRNNKTLIANIKPTRSLNKKDIEAMKFIEVDGNLSVDPIPFLKRNPERIIHKAVWKFTACNFEVAPYRQGKIIAHHFYTSINNQLIEVKVPEAFIPFLIVHKRYKNKTIELLYNYDHFTLFTLEEEIGYHSLYKKLTTNDGSERKPTKKELNAFMFSIWNSVWGIIIAPVCLPALLLGLMQEGYTAITLMIEFPFLFLLFALIFLTITIPFCLAYKKRKKYLHSIKVHTLTGKLWYDEKKHLYRINENELKLHRKWRKTLKKIILPTEDVHMKALVHTYDNLNHKVIKQFQPIAIKSKDLNLNETILKSTRSWVTVFLYWLSF